MNTGSMKRKGLLDTDGKGVYEGLSGKKHREHDAAGLAKLQQAKDIAKEHGEDLIKGVPELEPFVGAQPKLLRKPEIVSAADSARITKVACQALVAKIEASTSIHVMFAQDSMHSEATKGILESASDETEPAEAPNVACLADDWLHTLPHEKLPETIRGGERLVIYVGTPGKYLSMCTRSIRGVFDAAYAANRLVVLCRGVIMLPLGHQEQNVFGVESEEVVQAMAQALHAKGALVWGHGKSTKAPIMQKAFGYPMGSEMPEPLQYTGDTGGDMVQFDYFSSYIKYLNMVKLAKPTLPVTNYYDTGLTVSVLMSSVAQRGPSLLMDRDGLAMLRDASIGHIISKLNQVVAVEPHMSNRGVFNFFIGDGACRLNGGVELALHLIEGYKAKSLITMFVFNNGKWAIEDNLAGEAEKEHKLYNKEFYDLLEQHGSVTVCETDLELRETLSYLSRRTYDYVAGKVQPGLSLVVVRGLDMDLPPVLGDLDPIRGSPEMKFMRDVLGEFAKGCHHKIPIYGCSAFEYIQFLHIFMEEMPEASKFQYVCGRTDIQAAQMCGFNQPEGKCILFINDVYGVNSLGESLRSVLSGFGGKQLLLWIWHPSLTKLMDHFQLHRPPMVWPNLGPELCKYYVRKESDALFVDFEGAGSLPTVTSQVNAALAKGTPLVVVNVMPEHERDFVSLDIRVKAA